jgi:DNA (cytosine-5)-methyltransferase 1
VQQLRGLLVLDPPDSHGRLHLSTNRGLDRRSIQPKRTQAKSSLGRGADGIPRGLDAHQWPAGRGEPQHAWEPPRTTENKHERRQRLKALGNAVVPQVAYAIGCVVAEVLRREGER